MDFEKRRQLNIGARPKDFHKNRRSDWLKITIGPLFIIRIMAAEEETEVAKQEQMQEEDLLIAHLLMLVDQFILIQEKNVESAGNHDRRTQFGKISGPMARIVGDGTGK